MNLSVPHLLSKIWLSSDNSYPFEHLSQTCIRNQHSSLTWSQATSPPCGNQGRTAATQARKLCWDHGHIQTHCMGPAENVGGETIRAVEIPNATRAHFHVFYMSVAIHGVYYNHFHDLFSKVINSQLFLPKRPYMIILGNREQRLNALKFPALIGRWVVSHLPNPNVMKSSIRKHRDLKINGQRRDIFEGQIKGEMKK